MNYLVADFSQFDVMSDRIDKNPNAAQMGACHCFSLHWLRRVLSDSSELPSARLAKIKMDGGGLNLLLNDVYNRHLVHLELQQFEEADRMMLRLRGLKTLCLTIPWVGYRRSSLIRNVRSTEGGFVYTYQYDSLRDGRGLAHSVAFYSSSASDGLIYAFDSNLGEFHMMPEDLSPFWRMHLELYYGLPCYHMLKQIGVDDRDHVSQRRASSSG